MPTDLRKARELFLHAVGKLPTEQWNGYVAQACGGDADLAQQVESLLQVHREAGSFLDAPAAGLDVKLNQHPVEHPGTIIGPYKLRELLGEGGMGNVFVAEQLEPIRRKVALKIIKPGMDSRQVLGRFEAERQTLSLMDHPNIAKVLDAGTTEIGRPYFVMELVRGVPITEFCDQRRLDPRKRLELFIQVCRAIQHAHQKGIIHRDIKPTNILVTMHDELAVPKVIDFGIAKATDQRLTEQSVYTAFNQMIGTPLYMSPEQAEMNALDVETRSDVYSLGVLLYELLTGSTPFDTETLRQASFDEMRRLIREVDPPRPSQRVSTLDAEADSTVSHCRGVDERRLGRVLQGELDWIVMKALEKDRNRRYESVSALAADLERYLHDEPVQACPPSTLYRLKKLARRNRAGLATVAIVSLTLIAGTVVSVWQAIRATQARQVASTERDWAEAARRAEAEQRGRAVVSEQQAKQSAAESQAVIEFFEEKVLAAARPESQEGGLGVNATIRAAVVAAEPQIGPAFQGQPLVEASIRATLGDTFGSLGETELAVQQYERSRKLRSDKLGPDHPDTLGSMNDLAAAYGDNGQLDLAVPLNELTLELMKAKLGPDHRETLASMGNLATLYCETNQMDKAVPLHELTVEKMKAKLGPDHLQTLTSMLNLAYSYENVDKVDQARPIYEYVVQKRRAKLGPDHPDTLASMQFLASANGGQHDLALPLYELTLEKRKAKLGWDHPDTFRTVLEFNIAVQSAGYPDLSKALIAKTVEMRNGSPYPVNGDTLGTMRVLANCYGTPRHPDRDEPIWRDLAAFWKDKAGADSPQYADQLLRIGVSLLAQQKAADAEPILRECLQIREQTKPDAWTRFRAMCLLGDSLLGQKKYAEAEPLLLDGYAGMQARETKMYSSCKIFVTEALQSLVQLYEAWGQKDKAAEWQKKLDAVKSVQSTAAKTD